MAGSSHTCLPFSVSYTENDVLIHSRALARERIAFGGFESWYRY